MTMPKLDQLKPFAAHGVTFNGVTGNQAYGRCPFSGRENKFYVNLDTLLWDSKITGLSGNLTQFFEHRHKMYRQAITPQYLGVLAANRKLPTSVFAPWELGWNGVSYMIPVRDTKGHIQDIRAYKLGQHCMSTPGCHSGLLGCHEMVKRTTEPIFVCEGEWDGMALSWLLRKLELPGVVVSVPGAATFKQEWVPWFAQRTVFACYDNDGAGENGEQVLKKRLEGTAKAIWYCHWPPSTPEKFDVRDWVINGAVKAGKPRECWKGLASLFKKEARPPTHGQPTQVVPLLKTAKPSVPNTWEGKTATLEDVKRVFKKWLFLDNTDALEIMLSVIVSNYIEGDPIWMFLVSPPGGAKTELLTSLGNCEQVYPVSSITSHSLISGASWATGDPSLIPKLNGRILVIKDFTSILSKRDQEKDEIFGILRDAYDGKCVKVFGNGTTRAYESRFSIMAAVTPYIYELSSQHASLGERFLKFTAGDNLFHLSEDEIIRRSIQNVNKETSMREDLANVVTSALKRVMPKELPTMDPEMLTKIVALARFGARLRGIVARDHYHSEMITGRPSAEIGSRLGKQLSKLAMSIAIVNGHTSVGEGEYRLVRKTVLDTIPQRTEDMVRKLWEKTPTLDDSLKTKEISYLTRYPLATVSRILADLNILDIVTKAGKSNAYQWTLSAYIRAAIQEADLYPVGTGGADRAPLEEVELA